MLKSTPHVYRWFIVLFCTYQCTLASNLCTPQDTTRPWLTILVHGIISVKPFLSPYNIYILMRDDIHGSVYAHTIAHARQDPFFEQYHAMQSIGLKRTDVETIIPGNASSAFARSYNLLTQFVDPSQENICYTYGWSALLSKKLWVHEGERFYHSICKEIEQFRARGINPRIRIIGYSHGGTIAVNLANAYNTTAHTCSFEVDELILLGMPGVPEAKELIHSPLFKKIYHIYSHGDRVQTLDFFSLNVLLSKKTFWGSCKNPLPDNFYQIGIKMYRPSKGCLAKCPCGHGFPAPPRHIRPAHPGHSELWSFGWGGGYRNYFPMYPLPMGVFIPWLTQVAQEHSYCSHHISVALHPYAQMAEFQCHASGQRTPIPGIPQCLLKDMQHDALQFSPLECGPQPYARQLKIAVRKAHEELKHVYCD